MSHIENSGAGLWALEIFKKPGERQPGFIIWLGHREPHIYLTIEKRKKPHPDLTGQLFTRLTTLAPMPGQRWLCRCSCGKYVFVLTERLLTCKSRSCGCYRRELSLASRVARGEVRPPRRKHSYEAAARINAKNGTTTMIPLAEYAAMHGRPYSTVLYHIKCGYFKTAIKAHGVHLLDGAEPYPAALPRKGSTPRSCRICEKVFIGEYNNRYCSECRMRCKRESIKFYNNGFAVERRDERACARCGILFTVRGGKRRYCPDCARSRISEYVEAQKVQIPWPRE